MGIPSYFNFILKNHSKIIKKKSHVKSDFLFIDANSIIYDTIHTFHENVPCQNIVIYDKIYENICKLINSINPNFKSFVCFDGIPPCAKMAQQRQRRFKSSLTKEILGESPSAWNRNQITPGTTFMKGLDEYLTNRMKNDKNIIFSSSTEPMEGEHKICNIIKQNTNFKNHNLIIYGLDADLFMLGLLLVFHDFKIYLYKETSHFSYIKSIDKNEKYYFDIRNFSSELSFKLKCSVKQSICDYCLMAFLCGNDFLPHLHSINIRHNGIPYIIDTYLKLGGVNNPLVDVTKGTINWKHFRIFITMLANDERENISLNLKWKINQKKKKHPLNDVDKLDLLPCFDTEKEEYVRDNMDELKSVLFENHSIKNICCNYLEMIEWTWYYYYNNNVIDNTKYYIHNHAPLLNDLIPYIPIMNSEVMLSKTNSIEIDETALLFYVLPYNEHSKIIPEEIYNKTSNEVYKKISLIKETNCEVDYFLCKYFWESHLQLPYIDILKLNDVILKNL